MKTGFHRHSSCFFILSLGVCFWLPTGSLRAGEEATEVGIVRGWRVTLDRDFRLGLLRPDAANTSVDAEVRFIPPPLATQALLAITLAG